jgi:hypothetical protein
VVSHLKRTKKQTNGFIIREPYMYMRHIGERRGRDCMVVGFTTTFYFIFCCCNFPYFYIQYRHYKSFTQQDITHTIFKDIASIEATAVKKNR